LATPFQEYPQRTSALDGKLFASNPLRLSPNKLIVKLPRRTYLNLMTEPAGKTAPTSLFSSIENYYIDTDYYEARNSIRIVM
jgi:hypothetical protein